VAVIDLKKRITENWTEFTQNKYSDSSYVYVEGGIVVPDDSKVALDLAVGSSWFDYGRNTFWEIPSEGLTIAPKAAAVVETKQKLSLPFNVFGLVTGKGKYIYQAVLVSPGKIDPNFSGHLRIGVYNASDVPITMLAGNLFCSCCFISTESTVEVPQKAVMQPPLRKSKVPWSVTLRDFGRKYWDRIILVAFAGISCAAAVLTFLAKTQAK
jgi:dUTPase